MTPEQCMSITACIAGIIFLTGICTIVHTDILCRQVNLTNILIQHQCDEQITILDEYKVKLYFLYLGCLSTGLMLLKYTLTKLCIDIGDFFIPDPGDLSTIGQGKRVRRCA